MKARNTIQKQLILDAVHGLNNHPTAEDIYAEVTRANPQISKGTVYRNLTQMADRGDVLRVPIANGPDCFDFRLDKHCHFKCTNCGKVYDFPYTHNLDLLSLGQDDFQVEDYEFLFTGLCKHCKEE